jgi:sigma-E factor negative regulatory protein RseC
VIEQPGIVTAMRDGRVRVDASGSAGGCDTCGKNGCGTASLARFFGRRSREVWVDNAVRAAVGDRVVIGLDEAALQRAALNAYLWPLLGLLAGSVAGDLLATPETGELAGIAVGLMGLFAGILYARHRAGRAAGADGQPRLLRVTRAAGLAAVVAPPMRDTAP